MMPWRLVPTAPSTVHKVTKIDKWFLKQIEELIEIENEIEEFDLGNIPTGTVRKAKKGYAVGKLRTCCTCYESEVRAKAYRAGH